MHTTSANAVTLVWGSLRLAPISKQSNQVCIQYNVMFFSYKPCCPHCQLSVLKVSWEIKCKSMGCYSLKFITYNFRALPLP